MDRQVERALHQGWGGHIARQVSCVVLRKNNTSNATVRARFRYPSSTPSNRADCQQAGEHKALCSARLLRCSCRVKRDAVSFYTFGYLTEQCCCVPSRRVQASCSPQKVRCCSRIRGISERLYGRHTKGGFQDTSHLLIVQRKKMIGIASASGFRILRTLVKKSC